MISGNKSFGEIVNICYILVLIEKRRNNKNIQNKKNRTIQKDTKNT